MEEKGIELRIGDRIRLRRDVAKSTNLYHMKHRKVNWLTRQGSVVRIGLWTDTIFVKWDDRRSIDAWPMAAIEKCKVIEHV